MDPRTQKFIFFAAFGVASLIAGYLCHTRRVLGPHDSRRIHWHTMVWVWPAASFIACWNQPLALEELWLVVAQVVIVLFGGFAVIPFARWWGLSRNHTGVVAIASSLSNIGFTLGGYLCYSLFGDQALTYSILYVSIMTIAGIVFMYPVAMYYGEGEGHGRDAARLIVASLLDVRSLGLYAALAGLILGEFRAPPQWLARWHVIDVLFYMGAFGGYFPIGINLRLGETFKHMRAHTLVGLMHFAAIPLVSLALVMLSDHMPWPMSGDVRSVVLVQSFMPTAITTVMIVNLFHLDIKCASVVWLWNTIAFMLVPLPLILHFAHR